MSQTLSDRINQLVEEHEAALVRYTCTIVRDREQAKDIVQDAYIKFINEVQSDKEIENDKSWLYRVCHNLALDHVRKVKRRSEKSEDVKAAPVSASSEKSPDKELNSKEDAALVRESLEELNEREQKIIHMKVKDNLSYKEIASELDLTVNNVGFILHRAMKKLAEVFKEKNKEEVCR